MSIGKKIVNGIEVDPTQEEIDAFEAAEAEHAALMEELAKVKYKEDRRRVYPSINDLVVAIMDEKAGDSTKINELIAQRAAVKAQFPKPE